MCNDGQASGEQRGNVEFFFFIFPLENKSEHCLQTLVYTFTASDQKYTASLPITLSAIENAYKTII